MGISEDAVTYARAHKKEIADLFCDLKKFPASKKPETIFMAGSPGVGKTEFSKPFLKQLELKDPNRKFIRLDIDELREKLPQYTAKNSDQVQSASTILFDRIFDQIHKRRQNALIDTTFASPKALENVSRAIDRRRQVSIVYLYQDPQISWLYTKQREKLEGRTVPKGVFINAYFNARKNVNAMKKKFGSKVTLDLFEKDKNHDFQRKARFNIQSLDNYIKETYTRAQLEKVLPDEI
jgi:adenylylsulfate kinase-like enzyme